MGRLAIDYIQYLCDLFQKERLVKQGWPMDKATQACFRPTSKILFIISLCIDQYWVGPTRIRCLILRD